MPLGAVAIPRVEVSRPKVADLGIYSSVWGMVPGNDSDQARLGKSCCTKGQRSLSSRNSTGQMADIYWALSGYVPDTYRIRTGYVPDSS